MFYCEITHSVQCVEIVTFLRRQHRDTLNITLYSNTSNKIEIAENLLKQSIQQAGEYVLILKTSNST